MVIFPRSDMPQPAPRPSPARPHLPPGVPMRAAFLALVFALHPLGDGTTQEPVRASNNGSAKPAAQPARAVPVLILGTYHFANPNLDQVKTGFDDHKSERRQREIEDVCKLLAGFAPTKIAVEAPAGEALQRSFDGYRAGTRELAVNESEQLGMRLAKALGHERVFGIDSKLDLDLNAVMEASKRSGRNELLGFMGKSMARIEQLQQSLVKMTVRDALLAVNDPSLMPLGRDLYLRLAVVRDGDQYIGADQVARWYQRNFRMFANLAAVISPGDRVLLIVGSGHAPILRELVQADEGLRLVEPHEYLRAK